MATLVATLIPSMSSCISRMTNDEDTLQIMTMKVSKGLEFRTVVLLRVRPVPAGLGAIWDLVIY